MRSVVGLAVVCCLIFASVAWAQDELVPQPSAHYISDDLFIFLHAGPGRQYRILGSVDAGTPVTKTDSDEANDFVEIVDNNGRTGWIEVQFLSQQVSRRELLGQLREQAADAQSAVAPLRQQISRAKQTIATLEAQKAELKTRVEAANQQVQGLQETLENRQQDEQVHLLMVGGALVAGGLLLGIIVTFLPKRKKRNDEWMN